jgi:transcriptional regulator of acetoin/glycerol metabolism
VGEILPANIPRLRAAVVAPGSRLSGGTTMQEAERVQIERALGAQGGNIKAAAQTLGISRATLYRKAKKYDIPV